MIAALPQKVGRKANEVADAAPLIPEQPTIKKLQGAARNCRACPLWKTGTQTVFGAGASTAQVMSVFGAGASTAQVMFVGEQPGNEEDLSGKPFVGPAGKLLDQALEVAGIARDQTYVTNVVNHFKWEPRGKRRLHKKPNAREIAACRSWLEAELRVVQPQLLICLGATAAQALLGPDFRVSQQRGKLIPSEWAPRVMATAHPSSILRAPDEKAREEQMKQFIADLKVAAKIVKKLQ
jgi:uracil-DNA glycosylase